MGNAATSYLISDPIDDSLASAFGPTAARVDGSTSFRDKPRGSLCSQTVGEVGALTDLVVDTRGYVRLPGLTRPPLNPK